MLQKAEQYIEQNKVKREERPAFHVTPPVGWMNDPNGFSWYQGKLHLFYQYYPYATQWGPMHWGHQVSGDMIRWEELPTALAPDQRFDHAGCFSGSAIETEKGHVLVYTGVTKEKNEQGEEIERQNQCLAVGDGVTYEKAGSNPVISGDLLPESFSRADFRDPKIWKEGDTYYVAAGNRDQDRNGQVVLFSSKNLENWQYEGVLAHNEGVIGSMWECPDFFQLADQHVLICSPQDMKAEKYELHNGHNSVYFLGEYDPKTHKFQRKAPVSLDYGLDFYAPQTTELPDGRRILTAWMQSWDSAFIPAEQKWNGMMTLPRELTLEEGRIIQRPVRELDRYHRNELVAEELEIAGTCSLEGLKGRMIDFTVELLGGDYTEFRIDTACNEEYATSYTYQPQKQILEVDRTYSGVCRDINCQRKMLVKDTDQPLKLRFILDRNSVEVFVNDGKQTMSTAVFTPQEADGIRFFCDGSVRVRVKKYDIVMDEV